MAEAALKPKIVEYIKKELQKTPTHGNLVLFKNNLTEYEGDISHSVLITTAFPSVDTFRGSIQEYLAQFRTLGEIKRIELTGLKLAPGVYDSSTPLNPDELKQLMTVIFEQNIKELSFMGVKLNPLIGQILGDALKNNSSLTKLEVNSNQLKKEGLVFLLQGLKSNHSIKTLYCRSYNVDRYNWSKDELELLKEVLSINSTITDIKLTNNQIMDPKDITILTTLYAAIKDRKVATIAGLGLSSTLELPDFNMENANSLEEMSRIKFMHC